MSVENWVLIAAALSVVSTIIAAYVGRVAQQRQRKELESARRLGALRELTLRGAPSENTPTLEPTSNQSDGISEVIERIERLEAKVPGGEGILDIYTSVNDAILATRLESLGRRIDRLESEAMSSASVIAHVFGVIGGLGGLVAVFAFVLEQFAG